MKLLFIHSDLIEFEAKKPALPDAGELPEELESGRLEDALVVFFSVESGDTAAEDAVVERALEHVEDVAGQVNTDRVAVYPYAHLSEDLAPPDAADRIGTTFRERVEGAGYETIEAPFGWYKRFHIESKGHPMSELSRSVTAEEAEEELAERESEALEAEEELESHWYVLTPDGDLTAADAFDFSDHPDLETFYEYETAGSREASSEPAHVELMQDLELVDYEPASDGGNFRWYPKGYMIKDLLETRVSALVKDAGGMRVETPIMYDHDHEGLSKYLDRFPARQYVLQSEDKEFFLRFAACFGQYLIGHDATMSYRNLPMRLYELTHYSFRREQSGELSGLRRLRSFTMPDMHTFAADMDQAKEEFVSQYKQSMEWMDDLGIPYQPAVRFVRDWYEGNEEFAQTLAELVDKPVLVEMWDERFFYFVTKFEFNVVDTQGKASALSTVQIDVENTERFDITYTTEDGDQEHPYLLHASLSGSVDRNLYALLETEARRMEEADQKPELPYWLAPTQVRFVPVSDEHIGAVEELADDLPARADVDDRAEGVGRKIRDAETEWVPYTVVYGDDEAESGELSVRTREGEETDMTPKELEAELEGRQGDRPFEELPLPEKLSRRPAFRG
jgi:threonyl-tRNA synthetase